MDSTERFANEVRRYRNWLIEGRDEEAEAAFNAFLRLSRLVTATFELPALNWDGSDVESDVPHEEWQRAVAAARRLPVDLYKDVYDPSPDDTREPVVGSLSDDLADIYRDVVRGLCAFERGDLNDALWEWRFGFANHWGAHATAAMRVLQRWLQENDPHRLYGLSPKGESGSG